MTCLRAHEDLLDAIQEWTGEVGQHALADLGCEGQAEVFTLPIKKTKAVKLTDDQKMHKCCAASACHPTGSATSSPTLSSCTQQEHRRAA